MGFYSKFYSGPAQDWVRDSLGGVFYVIFWCLAIFFFFPTLKNWIITFVVLTCTCILEFAQLWHPLLLERLRGNFVGRTILGTTFAWFDFPYYFVGACLGWLWLRMLRKNAGRRQLILPKRL
jgi:hypothetical protein